MNIFLILLISLFMSGYYLFSAPNQTISTDASDLTDLRSVVQCVSSEHNAVIRGTSFENDCLTKYSIHTEVFCLNKNLKITDCDKLESRKTSYSFIITSSEIIPETKYNDIFEVLEKYYSDNMGTFGIFSDRYVLSATSSDKRIIPKEIISTMDLQNGQLVFITQYEVPDPQTIFSDIEDDDLTCPIGTSKVYKFGRWQCIEYNYKQVCTGDTIWDSDSQECIADETRKPLCAEGQSAVLNDDVWQCVNPFPERECPSNQIAKLNYSSMEWECIDKLDTNTESTKCDNVKSYILSGSEGTLRRIPVSGCTDCEKMITNTETCETTCVPDPSKINDSNCYPTTLSRCSGANSGFYFGFPTLAYANKVSAIAGYTIPFDSQYSKNRKFNCIDCGTAGINNEESLPPYIIKCN